MSQTMNIYVINASVAVLGGTGKVASGVGFAKRL